MCIIAIKPKNKDIQEKKILERCFINNQDGAGYMFVDDNNKVVIKKGFMKFEEFYKTIMKDYKENKLKDKTLVMHFRIGTSGKNKIGCTHPFPITDKFDELELTRHATNIGICHNGIVQGFNSYANQYSDTELYIATVITPLIRLNLQSYKFNDVQQLILTTTNSKWAILDKNDEYYTIGQFIEDNGYYYSNETFKPRQYAYLKYEEDDEDDLIVQSSWYHRAYKKQQTHDKKTYLPATPDVAKETPIDDKIYNKLKIGNVACATATDVFYKKTLTWLEIKNNDEYYFDKDYNIYRRFKGDVKQPLRQIGKEAVIYTNEMLMQRRGFNE